MTLEGSLSYSSREVRQTLNTAANSDSPGVALKNKIIKYKYFVFFQDLSQSHTKSQDNPTRDEPGPFTNMVTVLQIHNRIIKTPSWEWVYQTKKQEYYCNKVINNLTILGSIKTCLSLSQLLSGERLLGEDQLISRT